MVVNRPYPMSTLVNAADPTRLFDMRLFARRVVGAIFDMDEEDPKHDWQGGC